MMIMKMTTAPIAMPTLAPVDGDEDGAMMVSVFVFVDDDEGVICEFGSGNVEVVVDSVNEGRADDELEVGTLMLVMSPALTTNWPLKSFPAGAVPPFQSQTST
jgi:hypothetical protein